MFIVGRRTYLQGVTDSFVLKRLRLDITGRERENCKRTLNLGNQTSLVLQAKRPDLALEMYQENLMWEDAIRVAEKYAPSKISEIHAELAQYVQRYRFVLK